MSGLDGTGLPQEVIALLRSPNPDSELRLVLRNVGVGYTAIRDDDLPLARDVALTVASFFGATLASWAPTAIATLVLFLLDIRKKGIPLSTLQGTVLKEVRSNVGLSPRQVAAGLKLKEPDVKAALESLRQVTRMDGRVVALVDERDSGKWYALDV